MQNDYILNAFQAYVDTIIPRTPGLAEVYGYIQYYGALDLQVDQFLLYNFEHVSMSSAELAALLLNAAAVQWLVNQGYEGRGSLDLLPPSDRLSAIMLLELQQMDPRLLSEEFLNDPGLMVMLTDTLLYYTLQGYYSEWAGYGTTRLNPPQERVLEYFPLSWEQVGYPGPSLGYRVLRTVDIS
ncbi:MAG: hypothetical protein H6Q59_2867 [Firmicutes bacterium]|nr:hypothetical protein [Bacillota bacterium]